jgi:two-component system chemotaxis sensor kinase CheA
MALEQLPKRLVKEGRYYDFAYHPVIPHQDVERIVIVLTDVTAEVERQRALAEQHEFSVLVDQYVRDRRAFFDFWNEASALIERIVEAPEDESGAAVRRDIHTLKGNSRFFGLTRLSGMCHALEDAMQERGENQLTLKEREELNQTWESLRRRIDPLVHGATAFLEISEEEYARLEQSLRTNMPHGKLLEIVEGLRHEPTEWRLKRAQKSLVVTCKKLGKTPVEVDMQHHELRMPPGRLDPFWSVLQHVLTNAIDHGLEPDRERSALNKPLPGRVRLSTELVGNDFVVDVEDDGRGIDWDKVRERAEHAKLPARTRGDLVAALLSEGFTLKEEVSTISGRGVGLSALSSVLKALGGTVELTSEKGKGSTWRFKLPVGHLTADAGQQRPAASPPRKTGSS